MAVPSCACLVWLERDPTHAGPRGGMIHGNLP